MDGWILGWMHFPSVYSWVFSIQPIGVNSCPSSSSSRVFLLLSSAAFRPICGQTALRSTFLFCSHFTQTCPIAKAGGDEKCLAKGGKNSGMCHILEEPLALGKR